MEKVIIDRFEGDMVVLELETGETIDVFKKEIPTEAVEGDILIKTAQGMFEIDKEHTDKLKREIGALMDKLFVD